MRRGRSKPLVQHLDLYDPGTMASEAVDADVGFR